MGLMYGLKPVPFTEAIPFPETNDPAAPSGRLELLAGVVEETMRAAGYSPGTMQEANRHDLRLLLRRLGLPERDLRRILGLFRQILWRLRHGSKGASRFLFDQGKKAC
jgi:tRNA/rRNA methyltransferase